MARQIGRLDWFGAYGFIYHLDGRLAARADRSAFNGAGGGAVLHKSLVAFSATRAPGHTHPLARNVRLLTEETDPDLLRACFENRDKDIWPLVATRYLSTMPEQAALEIVRARLAEADDPLLLLYRIPPRVLLLPEARDVRERFPLEDRLTLYESFLDLSPFQDEIMECLSREPSRRHDRLWRRLLADERDMDRLRAHFLSANSSEWQAVASRYLAALPPQEALAAIRTKLETVRKASILLPHVPVAVLALPDARDVRIGMPAGKRLKLLSAFEDLDAHVDELAETLARASAESVAAFWKQVADRVTPGSALSGLMPIETNPVPATERDSSDEVNSHALMPVETDAAPAAASSPETLSMSDLAQPASELSSGQAPPDSPDATASET